MRRDVRVGVPEREEASRRLGEHYAQGRLEQEEYAERLDAVWEARTSGQLAAVFADLPRLPVLAPRPPAPPSSGFHWSRVPVFPVLMVCVVLSVVTGQPWWILAVVWWCAAGTVRTKQRAARMIQRLPRGLPVPPGHWPR